MKNVVMIACHFPPEGNAGAYRPLRFVRQLPNFGWKPTVISSVPSQYDRYDPALLARIPSEAEIIHTRGYDLWQAFQCWRERRARSSSPLVLGEDVENVADGQHGNFRTRLRKMVHTAEAWWYHPDRAAPWINSSAQATIAACLRNQASVIWATAGPVTSFYVAWLASRKTGVPYVLDFRDSWTITYNEFEARRPSWAIRRDRKKMYELLHHAKAVVFRYDTEAECFWRAYRGALDASKVYIIANGYESPIEEFVAPTADKCTILYAGTLPDYRYDTLLKSLSVLKETNPRLAKQLRLLFVGEGMNALAKDVAACDLTDIVETAGPKSYFEITCLQREAHALLVLGRPATMKGYELFAGAKLFGYLKAGRPIVGVLPSDETKKVLHRVRVRTVADVDSVSEIMKVLRLVLDSWSTETLSLLVPDPKACEPYSSERQTETLVHAFEGVRPEEPFIPGAQEVPPSLREIVEDKKWLDAAR
jgi:glycosyltransferase involved in cell wall biosynthesis